MKSTTIFTDQNAEEKKGETPHSKDSQVVLSKDDYHEVVKEAYKEGASDILKEQKKDSSKPETSEQKYQSIHPADHNDSSEQLQAEKEGREEGEVEAHKTEAKVQEQTKHKLETLADRHDVELLHVKTVFPITLFPDTLIIDTTKVAIVKKQFFMTEHVTTIPLKDLADTQIQSALFLSSLIINYLPQASSTGLIKLVTISISALKRADAIRAKNILKGILVARAEHIDISKLSPKEIMNIIEKVGSNTGVD